jgi:hypothetical protein
MKFSNIKSVLYLTTLISIAVGCAKHPDKIAAQYVSPIQYDNYTCDQISNEMRRLTTHISELAGKQEKAASGDSVKMGVGLVLFWPTLFFLDGNSPQAAEYAKLKGEFAALEQTAIKKNCGLNIEHLKAATAVPANKK